MGASKPLPKGTYAPSTPADLRSPCPMINALANHGYIARNGRNIPVDDILAAMSNQVGLSSALGAFFAKPLYLEYKRPSLAQLEKKAAENKSRMCFAYVWNLILVFLGYISYLVRHPWALFFSALALRKRGQTDSAGQKCLNLDQFAIHGVIEHDVSLTRHDNAQGNNVTPQQDLIRDLLASSSDGGKTFTTADLAAVRKRRIETQRRLNPTIQYGPKEHLFGCTEIGLIIGVLGDGHRVKREYLRALFEEERLPIREGWQKRSYWWPLGFGELTIITCRALQSIGAKLELKI